MKVSVFAFGGMTLAMLDQAAKSSVFILRTERCRRVVKQAPAIEPQAFGVERDITNSSMVILGRSPRLTDGKSETFTRFQSPKETKILSSLTTSLFPQSPTVYMARAAGSGDGRG